VAVIWLLLGVAGASQLCGDTFLTESFSRQKRNGDKLRPGLAFKRVTSDLTVLMTLDGDVTVTGKPGTFLSGAIGGTDMYVLSASFQKQTAVLRYTATTNKLRQ
jgi:hypothetical protein